MTISWHFEEGHSACRWSAVDPAEPYRPGWMQDTTDGPSGYLLPLPDFASRSPFGGVAGFQPNPRDSE